ncbi:CdvA-like protein [Candidatus Bathyarchaeota archaeon]|nr:CdvA-like protein [Candidatus Bathyarchaeota archaeon]
MGLEFEGFKKFLGKHVVDGYGRPLGRVVGLITDVNQNVTDVEIEFGNGEFVRCPSKQLMIEAGTLIYLYPWELESTEIAKALDLAIKRIQALDDLFRMGEIPGETYEEFKKIHEASFRELRERRDRLINRLKGRIGKLNSQIRELQMFRTSLKMQRATGEIEEDSFKEAISIVEDGLNKAFTEKEELENTINRLSKLDFKPSSLRKDIKTVLPKPPKVEVKPEPRISKPSIEEESRKEDLGDKNKESPPIDVKVED